MKQRPAFLSIVVPVLNEAGLIGGLLRYLRTFGAGLEIIVVDGGSSDATLSTAQPLADRVVTAPRGRASQMNAGAEIARGDVLWFLHADLKPSSLSIDAIRATLADPRIAGGCFRLRYPRREWIYRVSDWLGNFGVKLFGFALGDHGIFCRRSAFFRVGGYPGVPILEDAELCRRLWRVGRLRASRGKLVRAADVCKIRALSRNGGLFPISRALCRGRVANPSLQGFSSRLHHALLVSSQR